MQINPPPHGLIQTIEKLLSSEQLKTAVCKAKQQEQPLLSYLIDEKILSATTIAQACADFFNVDYVDLYQFHQRQLPLEYIQETLLQRYILLPLEFNNGTLTIAVSDPAYFYMVEEIKFQIQLKIKMVIAAHDQLTFLINKILSEKFYKNNNGSTVSIIERVLTDAVYQHASDIHFEPMENNYRIRVRIDGILNNLYHPAAEYSASIASRLKIMADLDIAEKRLPQDGRFTFTTHTQLRRDCRVSTCPTMHGEKTVIRVLNPQKHLLAMNELGLEKKQKKLFINAIRQPQGLILVTGPTGSGKTISLYAALNALNTTERNMVTVEDPIEIPLNGINQVNVNIKIGLDFSKTLRAFLRQDPDVIMVGEIRDFETADIAIRAAQTGHLVLSTLHTNSAAEALTRLMNMGVASYNIASSVNLIIAQRLIRKLCPHCKTSTIVSTETLAQMGWQSNESDSCKIYEAASCRFCTNGYQGRTGVFEVLPVTATLRELILSNYAASKIADAATLQGMKKLWHAGLEKIKQGISSLTEINRVIEKNYK